ncbi:Hypothetical protein, putative, partial [Bodo saltans]
MKFVSGDLQHVQLLAQTLSFFAMSEDNWNVLSSRYVDCRYGRGRLDTHSTIFDLRLPDTWTGPNVIVLIGGESGSGKTMEMLCGHCDN